MSRLRDDLCYLQDIFLNAQLVLDFTANMNEQAFYADTKTFYAVTRCFEIMGEAAKKLSPETKNDLSDIPWRKVAGFRDILIHEYHAVESERVWITSQENLPQLVKRLKTYLEKKGS